MSDHKRNSVLSRFFQLIPRIFCISYFSNHERRAKIQSLWNELGIENKIEYTYGYPDRKSYKCSCKVIQDHVSTFRKAYRENWPFVFIFEDDATLYENMMETELEEIQKFLNVGKDGRGWSALTLGYDPRHFFMYDSWNFDKDKSEKNKKNIFGGAKRPRAPQNRDVRDFGGMSSETCEGSGEASVARVPENILFRMNGLFSHAYLISREGMEKFLLSWREPVHPLHVGVIDSFLLVDDGVYGLTHNIFGQLGFDMKQDFNHLNTFIFWLANWIWWNRLENIGILLIVLFLWRKMKMIRV